MILDPDVDVSRYCLHTRALDRHAAWAREFAEAGDVSAAMEALHDFYAVASELVGTQEPS
jgi:hypothetical protein